MNGSKNYGKIIYRSKILSHCTVRKRFLIPLLILVGIWIWLSIVVYNGRKACWSGIRYENYESGAKKIERCYKCGEVIQVKYYAEDGRLIREANFE